MIGISTKTIYAVVALHGLGMIRIGGVLKTDAFSDLCCTNNAVLKLFWEDIKKGIFEVFDVLSLSDLKSYRMKANKALNYSI